MLRDLGNMIDCFITTAPCTIGTGATLVEATSVGADRTGYESAVFIFTNCLPKGTPTGVTVTCTVKDSADDSTYTAITSASETHNITNTYTITEIPVNLGGAAKYVQGVISVQFNGGTGPFIICDAVGILGAPQEYPV